MSKLKGFYIFFAMIFIFIGLLDMIFLTDHIYHFNYYKKIKVIESEYLGNDIFELSIPIEHINISLDKYKKIPLNTKDNLQFVLFYNQDSPQMFLRLTRWGISGFVIYQVFYEISDKNIKQKILKEISKKTISKQK